jgi:hypothetical protein
MLRLPPRVAALFSMVGVTVGCVAAFAGDARADEPGSGATHATQGAQSAQAAAAPVILVVHGDDLPREALRRAVARELGREVLLEDDARAASSTGASGASGASGSTGATGASGASGSTGATGATRASGATGATDATGATTATSGAGRGGVVTVTYRRDARELAVTWDGPKRGTVSRVVPAPASRDACVSDAAMLAGDLARDEAADLLAPAQDARPATALPPLPSAVAGADGASAASAGGAGDAARAGSPASAPAAGADRTARGRGERDPDFVAGNVSVVYPLAINNGRPWIRTSFGLNLLHGRVGQLDGLQLGGVNVVARSDGRGTGEVTGIQLAYALNVATGAVSGVQLAWLGNSAGGLEGWQASMIANHASARVAGLQTAMGVNVARDLGGVQLAGVNVARDLAGVQLGLVNVARKVDGAMVGLVNVADDVDGVPFGLVSVTRTGGVHPTAWASNTSLANLGIRLATKHTYTMPMAHYHHAYGRDFYGAGFAIGGRITIDEARYVDTDLGFSTLYAPERSRLPGEADTYHELLLQPKLRALFGWRFADHFGLFAGGGLTTQVRLEKDGDRATVRVGPELFAGVEL